MSKKFENFLDDLVKQFVNKGNGGIFLDELVLFGVLSIPEKQTIEPNHTDAGKFNGIFTALKNKQGDLVFPALQNICVKLGWRPVLKWIQTKLRLEEMEQYIVPHLELQKNHKIFKHSLPTAQMLFVGRNDYLKKIHNLIEKDRVEGQCNQSSLVKVVVTGLGGIGKTQLVLQYVKKVQLEYGSVIWINAECHQTAEAAFKSIGLKLGTFNDKMDIRSNVEAIYEYLRDHFSRNLIIFDNADDYIPEEFWFDELDNFVIILTSRNRDWSHFENKVDVDVFQHCEATEFVKKSLVEKNYNSTAEIDSFIKALEFFPLALQQAVAYIQQTSKEVKMLSNPFTISDYLKEYVEEKKKLLNYKFKMGNNCTNIKTTLNTWSVTVAKLKTLHYDEISAAEMPHDTLPIQILNMIAFLNGKQIDPNYFLEFASSNKRYLAWAIHTLQQYSMINETSIDEGDQRTLISVHKLVQEVTRIRLADENLAVETFAHVVASLLPRLLPGYNEDKSDVLAALETVMHLCCNARDMITFLRLLDNDESLNLNLYMCSRLFSRVQAMNATGLGTGVPQLPHCDSETAKVFLQLSSNDAQKLQPISAKPPATWDISFEVAEKVTECVSSMCSFMHLLIISSERSLDVTQFQTKRLELTTRLSSLMQTFERCNEPTSEVSESRAKFRGIISRLSEYIANTASFQDSIMPSTLACKIMVTDTVSEILEYLNAVTDDVQLPVRRVAIYFMQRNFDSLENSLFNETANNTEILTECLTYYKQYYSANHPKILRCLKYLAEAYGSKCNFSKQSEILSEINHLKHPNEPCNIVCLIEEPLD